MRLREKIVLQQKGIDPRLYKLWDNILQRCSNPNYNHYAYYGGRGIVVCKRWHSFSAFAHDVVAKIGPHPGKGWTLDRKQNNGHYCKANVRWATYAMQNTNKRTTVTKQLQLI